jgi:hypothetical protein
MVWQVQAKSGQSDFISQRGLGVPPAGVFWHKSAKAYAGLNEFTEKR